MVIEYTNAQTHPHRSFAATFFVVSSIVFLFIPTSLIVLGYYSTQPTGNLISPLPQGVISQYPTPNLIEENNSTDNQPIIAADNSSTPSSITQSTSGNSTDHTATLLATTTEVTVTDENVKEYSQILIVPKADDKSIYFVKSKSDGSFVLSTDSASQSDRLVDYQIVNP